VPPAEPAKTLRDQVNEIEKILSDAQQLTQARYALETLKERIDALYAAPRR
jgi:hypothetical protein